MDQYANLSDDGEVDHSFFDSDDDEEKGRTIVTTSDTNKHEYGENKKDPGSKEREDREQETSKMESEEESKASIDKSSPEPESSPCPVRPRSAVKSGRESAQSLRIEATIPTGIPQIRREFEDNYYPDEEDSSEEESRSSRPKTAKQTNIGKKNVTKYSRDFPSSISSSDTEFSDAPSDDQTSKSYQSLRDKVPSSLRSPERKASRPPIRDLRDYADESEDTVTDVTPLSTPDISPISSFDIAATSEALRSKVKRQENVSQEIYEPDFESKSEPKAFQDAMDLNQLLKAFMNLDKKEQKGLSVDQPPIRHKKNYSFNNDEVRHIDRENQRLLKELSRQASKSKSKSLTPKKPNGTPSRLYHSALNRQREQQRIERENMALLKRLESVKPTVGMTRSEQLMDYQRQAGYLSSTATSPRPGKASVSRLSSSSSGGLSRVSSASSRSGRMGSNGALLRPSKSCNARAAWM